ncbi:MAG TPA: hypothetical protein VK527_10945, partial [Candidatus Limnocylindrales bacterium]|nr:hypothetical protein [Candidatus Limnocylindrales bacterium]
VGKVLEIWPYAASVVFFLLAMLSKVSVVVLPAFLLLLDWMPDPRAPRAARPSLLGAVVSKIPFAIIAAILIIVNSHVQVTARAAYAHEPLQYLTVKGHAVWKYLGLLVGFGGSPDYDLPQRGGALAIARDLGGLAVLPLLAILILRRKRRIEFLGVSWMFITLLPALLFPLVTYMADRYLYAPSVGFCWALAAVVWGGTAGGAAGRASRGPRTYAAAAVTAALVLFFSVRTLQYSSVWKSSESLWTFALTKSIDYRVFNNMADVRMGQKNWAEAERLLKRGAVVDNVTSHQSLGVLYYNLHRYDEALAATDKALLILAGKARDPALAAELHFNRGAILWSQGKSSGAAEEWRMALRENPGHPGARQWLDEVAKPAVQGAP